MVLIMSTSNGKQNNNSDTEEINMVVMSDASEDQVDNWESSLGSNRDDGSHLMDDDVTAQLFAAGPVGVAAAAAVSSTKKRNRPHSFVTSPSKRKRHRNRLLRKLRRTIDEFGTRVGQQAVVLVATPGEPNATWKVYGAQPLEDVINNLRGIIMEELESALARQAPPPVKANPILFPLPPLVIDGIPTPVEKMTQAQLRAFIPHMLKYSTGRGKPGWGKESQRPLWWPQEIPFANVRKDARSEYQKRKTSWTHALKQIVISCYKFHGREDLLPVFTDEVEEANLVATDNGRATYNGRATDNGRATANGGVSTLTTTQYASTVLHTMANADGTLSITQIDPNNSLITLPDGTTTHLQDMTIIRAEQGNDTPMTIQMISQGGIQGAVVDVNSVAEVTVNSEGHIIVTADDGRISGVITAPATPLIYQATVANVQHLHTNSDGTFCVSPVAKVPKVEPNDGANTETLTVTPSGLTGQPTKATEGIADVKTEEAIVSD